MTSLDVQIAHVWRRLGFGATRADIDAGVAAGLTATIDGLLARPYTAPTTAVPNPWLFPTGTDYVAASLAMARQIELMAFGPSPVGSAVTSPSYNPLQERLSWILQGLVVAATVEGISHKEMLDHITALRTATSHRTLLQTITSRPAMLRYLNGHQNTKGHPNENYARELMELFAIGRVNPYDGTANYTQGDVTEMARALTGWQYNYTTGKTSFVASLWDSGNKTFRGASIGAAQVQQVMDALIAHPSWKYYVPARLYKELTGFSASPAVMDALAPVWGASGDLLATVGAIARRAEFVSDAAIFSRVKSPVELVASSARLLGFSGLGKDQNLSYSMTLLNQHPFQAPNVAGWFKGDQWLNATNLQRWVSHANAMAMKGFNWASTKVGAINPTTNVVFANSSAATAAGYVLHLAGLDNASPNTVAKLTDYAGAGSWTLGRAAGLLNLVLVSPEWLAN
jgi:uncharacterized protein (DUF1800 family)